MCWESKKRIVLVGDRHCGKTALAARLSQDLFLDEYVPTEFDDFVAEVNTKLGVCQLTVLDTCGEHEDASAVRSKAYKGCDAVVICFDLTDRETLESVRSHWVPEVHKHRPGIPFFIAGCKRDAMCDRAADGYACACGEAKCCTQTERDLLELIEKTGAVAYSECSAFTFDNVDELFQTVAETTQTSKRKNSTGQRIMRSLRKKSRRLQKRLSVHFS